MTKKMRRRYVINGVDGPYNVKEILDFLNGHIYDKIKISDIAIALKKSESTIKQLFSTYRADGIISYYNRLKINEAKKLIREHRYNVSQIAEMLCFDSPQYFSKCFKSYTNMTPSEYKKSIMK